MTTKKTALVTGANKGLRLATLGPDGPTGKFFHGDEELPW